MRLLPTTYGVAFPRLDGAVELAYTICFCLAGDRVLLIHRRYPPHQGEWNGVGGKIERGETLDAAVAREVLEEAALDMAEARRLDYRGVITWSHVQIASNAGKGMHAYVAEFRPSIVFAGERETAEGAIAWKPLGWATDRSSPGLASNVPHFLPHLLRCGQPKHYHCCYRDDGSFGRLLTKPLDLKKVSGTFL